MILVLAGTQDGRELAAYLTQNGLSVLVSVVSEYGKELAESQSLKAEAKALDTEGLIRRFSEENITLIVDATHPYAVNVSQNAMAAAKEAGLPYIRYERSLVTLPDYAKLHVVESYEEAADLAAALGKTIFLTTGSRRLAAFTSAPSLTSHRLIARVLPDAKVMEECLNLGLKAKDIIAMQGPFSEELNAALFKAFEAEVVVTKNSGTVGGSDTKISAAIKLGLEIVVIDRPRITYTEIAYTQDEVLAYVRQAI